MKLRHARVISSVVLAVFGSPIVTWAQSATSESTRTVVAGRPLDIVLDERVTIKHVGQIVTGVVVQPVYAYDQIVVPAGTQVRGHVAALEPASKVTRIRALLSGDLSPKRRVILQFDALLLPSGERPITTEIRTEIPNLKRTTGPSSNDDVAGTGRVEQVEREAKARAKQAIADGRQRGRDILADITKPGRTQRLENAIVQRLPYHPQIIAAGTGYHAELLTPLEFDAATASEPAAETARPAPSSILSVRLLTALDSAKTPRGTRIQAAVVEPVFSADHRLIIPEGTMLEGEVTLAKPARHLKRNGQLRFLFDTMHREATASAPLLASLQAVQSSGDDRLAIDNEGGAALKNSKTRFIAPALAVLALRGGLDHDQHLDPDGDGHMVQSNNGGALGVGGFLGFGVIGIGLSQLSRPLGVALSVVAVVRTMSANVLGKGREVQFPTDTAMELQLAPGPAGP